MDTEKYLELEYITLRKEIEECLTRSFQIMIGGATLIPIVAGFADKYSATPIMISLPLVVVIAALMYLNQWSMIMRAGRYIRTEIEPRLVNAVGWETWLERTGAAAKEQSGDNRLVDRYLAFAFYILTTGYFLASSWVGFDYARNHLQHGMHWVVLSVYIVTALATLIVLLRRVPTTTTTKEERTSIVTKVVKLRDERTLAHRTAGPDNVDVQTVVTEAVEQTHIDVELALARDHAEDLATPDRVLDREEKPTDS